jgi:hypothetical protein
MAQDSTYTMHNNLHEKTNIYDCFCRTNTRQSSKAANSGQDVRGTALALSQCNFTGKRMLHSSGYPKDTQIILIHLVQVVRDYTLVFQSVINKIMSLIYLLQTNTAASVACDLPMAYVTDSLDCSYDCGLPQPRC